jgi:hypothetical protein
MTMTRTRTTPRSLRSLFLTLMMLLATIVAAETVFTATAEARTAEGLSTCGSQAMPCMLDPVSIEAVDEGTPRERLAETHRLRKQLRVRT